MKIEELMRQQRLFDQRHAGKSDFFVEISQRNIRELEHLIVCLIGEVGEFANLTKKVVRGDFPLSKVKKQMHGEALDAFIYLVKICNQLDIDIEKEFRRKLRQNKRRFRRYEK